MATTTRPAKRSTSTAGAKPAARATSAKTTAAKAVKSATNEAKREAADVSRTVQAEAKGALTTVKTAAVKHRKLLAAAGIALAAGVAGVIALRRYPNAPRAMARTAGNLSRGLLATAAIGAAMENARSAAQHSKQLRRLRAAFDAAPGQFAAFSRKAPGEIARFSKRAPDRIKRALPF